MLGFLPNMIWFGRVWKWGSLSPKMVLFFFCRKHHPVDFGVPYFQSYSCETCFMSTFFFSFEEWFMKNIDQSWFLATIDVHEKPWFFYFHISSDVPSRDVENPHISWIPRIPMIFVGFVKSQRRTCHIFELWTAQHLLPLWCFMMFYDVSKLIMFHHLCFDFTHRFPHDGPVQKSRPGLSKWPSERWGTPPFWMSVNTVGYHWIEWTYDIPLMKYWEISI